MITLNNVSKKYRLYEKPSDRLKESINIFSKKYSKEFYALQDITFNVEKGQTIGIIGKNGSGKSTLLKLITGVLTPSTGEIKVNGKISAILELGAGFNPELTGVENIYLNGTMQGIPRIEMKKRIDQIIKFADIGEFINQPVKTYSSGMFSRLAFAVAINVDPDVLIVDEALAVGDMKFQAKCFNRFNELKEKGVTILFVGHDVSSIRNFCDRTLWLHEGSMVKYGNTLDVTSEYMQYMSDEENVVENHGDKEALYDDLMTNFNPINRWGSQQGVIKYVELYNSHDEKTQVVKFGEKIKLKVITEVPNEIDLNYLSIAFSIKNKVGTDLMVSTTYDQNHKLIKSNTGLIEVVFEFENYLTEDEYILVVALEDRKNFQPEYYDYIEGAKFFRVISEKKIFGFFHPPVNQNIKYLKG